MKPECPRKTVLTIAGFDPSSGAGVTADLMVFAAHGLFGTSAITALTVQSTLGVQGSYPVEAPILRETLDCLGADLRPSGIKIGMIGSPDNILTISKYIASLNEEDSDNTHLPVVLDPVLVSSSGRALLDASGSQAMKANLLPLVDWVTPNTHELAALTGSAVKTTGEMAQAARILQNRTGADRRGRRIGIFAKGGHLAKPDDLLLTPDGEEYWLEGERVETNATHGTGCALSSAFLSRLVLGDSPPNAARTAKAYVAEAMRQAPGIGQGNGPMGLLWPLLAEQHR